MGTPLPENLDFSVLMLPPIFLSVFMIYFLLFFFAF